MSTEVAARGRGGSTTRTATRPAAGATNFVYDALHRLMELNGATSASYTYNGDGVRVSKTAAMTTTRFVYDLSQQVPALLNDGDDCICGHELPAQVTTVLPAV